LCKWLKVGQAVTENDSELIECLFPMLDRHVPFFLNVLDGKVVDFAKSLVRGEDASIFDDFSDGTVNGFHSIGSVYNLPNGRRIGKEGAGFTPVLTP